MKLLDIQCRLNLLNVLIEAGSNGIVYTSRRATTKHNAAMSLYSNGLLRLVHSMGDVQLFTPTDEAIALYTQYHGRPLTGAEEDRRYWYDTKQWDLYRGRMFDDYLPEHDMHQKSAVYSEVKV